jgi:hypothetical protein
MIASPVVLAAGNSTSTRNPCHHFPNLITRTGFFCFFVYYIYIYICMYVCMVLYYYLIPTKVFLGFSKSTERPKSGAGRKKQLSFCFSYQTPASTLRDCMLKNAAFEKRNINQISERKKNIFKKWMETKCRRSLKKISVDFFLFLFSTKIIAFFAYRQNHL